MNSFFGRSSTSNWYITTTKFCVARHVFAPCGHTAIDSLMISIKFISLCCSGHPFLLLWFSFTNLFDDVCFPQITTSRVSSPFCLVIWEFFSSSLLFFACGMSSSATTMNRCFCAWLSVRPSLSLSLSHHPTHANHLFLFYYFVTRFISRLIMLL